MPKTRTPRPAPAAPPSDPTIAQVLLALADALERMEVKINALTALATGTATLMADISVKLGKP